MEAQSPVPLRLLEGPLVASGPWSPCKESAAAADRLPVAKPAPGAQAAAAATAVAAAALAASLLEVQQQQQRQQEAGSMSVSDEEESESESEEEAEEGAEPEASSGSPAGSCEVVDLVCSPPPAKAAAVAAPAGSAGIVDLCGGAGSGTPAAGPRSAADRGAAGSGKAAVINLCSDSESEEDEGDKEAQQQRQQQQQQGARAQQRQRLPMRGRGAAPRAQPALGAMAAAAAVAVKPEPGVAAAAAAAAGEVDEASPPAVAQARSDGSDSVGEEDEEEAAASTSSSEDDDEEAAPSAVGHSSSSQGEEEEEEGEEVVEAAGAAAEEEHQHVDQGSQQPSAAAGAKQQGGTTPAASAGLSAEPAAAPGQQQEEEEQQQQQGQQQEQQPMEWEASPPPSSTVDAASREASPADAGSAEAAEVAAAAATAAVDGAVAAAEAAATSADQQQQQQQTGPGPAGAMDVSAAAQAAAKAQPGAASASASRFSLTSFTPGLRRLALSVFRVAGKTPQLSAANTVAAAAAAAPAAAAGWAAGGSPAGHAGPSSQSAAGAAAAPVVDLAAASGSEEAAAVAAAAGTGLAAGTAPPAPEVPTAAAAADGAATDDDMPDQRDAGAMLRWLRQRIPPALLERYREPHTVSEEEQAVAAERLKIYEQEVLRVEAARLTESKFDLTAARNMEKKYESWGLFGREPGHRAGMVVGQVFKGRGPLAAMGLHHTYYSGIENVKPDPDAGEPGGARAICLSGGYEDDDDHGDWFWYTGEGGRDTQGIQVKDQVWKKGNAGLKLSMELGQPVRVIRAVPREPGEPKHTNYTYDGLYCVVKAVMEPSGRHGDGPLVIRFLLVGIPGHYKANKSVSWVELRGFRDNMRLAGPGSEEDSAEDSGEAGEEGEEEEESAAPCSKRQKTLKANAGKRAKAAAAAAAGAARRATAPKPGSKKRKAAAETAAGQLLHPAFVPVVQDAAWLAAQQRRPGFIAADVSNGVEQRQIPVFNEVDDERLPPGLEYLRTSVVGSAAAQEMLAAGLSVMPSSWCGRERGDWHGSFNKQGLMGYSRKLGHWECCAGCKKTGICSRNRVISERGVVLPLEVFRTHGKGWGVRCACDIPGGAFICSYEGELITHTEADASHREADSYLFDLDHFVNMHADPGTKPVARATLPPLPFDSTPECDHLVVNAHNKGSVARFLNHSCKPNLMSQPVLRQRDSGLRYCIALVSTEPIPAGTELCYDYNYMVGSVEGKEIQCRCGAEQCKGRLI